MIPKYLVFHNDHTDKAHAVWYLGAARHITLWQYLRSKDCITFAKPLSGGTALFNVKQKKFKPANSSLTLNVVPHDTDPEILLSSLTDNHKLCVFAADLGQAPEFSLVMGSSDVLKPALFEQGSIYGCGKVKYRIHDSNKPFKLEFDLQTTPFVAANYLEFVEDRLFF